jgi:HK97 family phage portal protein
MRLPWQKAATVPAVRETSHVWMLQGGEVRSLGSIADPTAELLALFGSPTQNGVVTGSRAALTCSASYAAIRLISDLCGELPVHVMRRGAGGNRERLRDHPADVLMNQFSNPWTSGAELRREITGTALLEGRGLAKVIRNRRGEARELHQISASVEIDSATQEPLYRVSNAKGGGTETLRWADVLDVRALGAEAPAKLGAEAIHMALLLERYGKQFFANHGRPSGLLIFKAKVDADTAREVREGWDDITLGDNSGGPAVLGHGVSYVPLSFTSTDSQYIENRKHQTLEILRFFGLPPTLAGELQDASLNNSENMRRDFLTLALSPWLSRWVEALSRCLLTPRERADTYLRFETKALTAADLKATMESFRQAVGGPIMSPNDARDRLDMPHVAGGDALYPPQGTNAPAAPASSS